VKSGCAGALANAIADRTPIIVAAAGIVRSASCIFPQDKQVSRMSIRSAALELISGRGLNSAAVARGNLT
jgi:hypothetical protein